MPDQGISDCLGTDEDGNITIIVEPAAGNGNGNGTNGANGNDRNRAALLRTASRVATRAGKVDRMSWEKDPSNGSVTFTPDDGETLHVSGDATMANVTTEPSPP